MVPMTRPTDPVAGVDAVGALRTEAPAVGLPSSGPPAGRTPAVGTPAVRRSGAVRRTAGVPTLRFERRLLRAGAQRIAAVDEVGRGSPAGPAYVGVVVVDARIGRPPIGVRDSKLLSSERREALVPAVRAWASDWAVGQVGPGEIDTFGLTAGLRLACCRALAGLVAPPDLVLLDGSHDWLTPPEADDPLDGLPDAEWSPAPVVTRVKADLDCVSVAAASILAKVARDALMIELAASFPGYGWHDNKGYGTSEHLEAIRRLGPTPHHRISWRLFGTT